MRAFWSIFNQLQPGRFDFTLQSLNANRKQLHPSQQRRKRMKFGKVGQVVLVSAIALVVATLFTACGTLTGATLTVGFLFVATNKQTPGQIEVYEVDSE